MAVSDDPLSDLKVSAQDSTQSAVEQKMPAENDLQLDELAGPSGGEESARLSKFWLDQIKAVDEVQRDWLKRGEKIIRRYRDERAGNPEKKDQARKFNSLWCNVEILHPALYGREPQPIVERRFRDKDPTGRTAATMLERALRNNMEISGYGIAVDQAVKDYLLPGRGVVWVRYEPEIGPGVSLPVENQIDIADSQGNIEPDEEEIEDSPSEQKLEGTGNRVIRESAPVDYVSWNDFYPFPARARIWKEITGVGKRCYLTRDQLKDRFGEEIGKAVPLAQPDDKNKKSGQLTSQFYNDNDARKAEVFEIWSRQDECVYWVAEGYGYLLDRKDDPLQLENFFPVPMPLQSNVTSDTFIPVADFVQYQDQAIQIDELTMRIYKLTQACKVAGIYNAAAKGIQRLLQEGVENELIPVDDWAAFAEKGGVAGQISLLPLKEVIGVINEITEIRQRVMADMDRLTGITDIMRGTSDARETMGAQRLKTNGASSRLVHRQMEVARFCRDVLRIQADIMAKQFTPETLMEMSAAMYDEGMGGDKTPVPVSPADPGIAEMFPDLVMPLSAVQGSPLASGPGAGMPPGGMQTPPPVAAPPGAVPGSMPPGLNMPPQGAMPGANPMVNAGVPPQVPGAPMPQPMPGAGQSPPPGMPPAGQMPMQGPAVASPPQFPGMPAPQPQMIVLPRGLVRIAAAINLLRNEKLRGFRIDIETDSTIFGDMQQEKADRVEFLKAVGPFMQQAVQLGTQMPQAAPMLGKFVQFVTRGFRVGRDLENAIEDFCDQAEKMATDKASNPMPPPPNPLEIKAQADQAKAASELQRTQIETQGEQNRQQLENQGDLQEAQVNAESKKLEAQAEMRRADLEEKQIELEMLREQNKTLEIKLKYGMHGNEMKDAHAQRQHEANLADLDSQESGVEHLRNLQSREHDHTLDQEKANNQNQFKLQGLAQKQFNKPPRPIQ